MRKYSGIICGLLVFFIGLTDWSQAADGFKVALLTPGSISDAGWNALAYDGLKQIETELGVEVSHVESRTPTEWEEHFRFYAGKGFNLVIGHGFEYQ